MKAKKKEYNGKYYSFFFILIYLLLVIFYDPLQLYLSRMTAYIDESMVAVFLFLSLLIILRSRKIRLYPFEKKILLLFSVIIAAGLYSLITNGKQLLIYGLADAVVFSKCLIMYFSSRVLFRNFDILKLSNKSIKIIKYMAVFIFFLLIANKVLHLFPQVDLRFGLLSEELFFGHPSRLAFFPIFTLCILLPFVKKDGKLYKNPYFFLLLLIGFFSLRIKFFGFMIIVLVAFLGLKYLRRINFKSPKTIIIGSLAVLLLLAVGYKQLTYHYSPKSFENGFARAVLLYKGFELAEKYSPLGSGFGTFASYYSGVSYSEVYYDLAIDNVYGLSPAHPGYIADSFWPMIIGQFGYLGLFCYAGIVILFMKRLLYLFNSVFKREEKFLYLSGLFLMTALLIDSTSDAIFSQNRAVASFFYFALIINHIPDLPRRASRSNVVQVSHAPDVSYRKPIQKNNLGFRA